MRYLLLLLAILVSGTSLAEDKPISKTYNCPGEGCSISCLTVTNKWSAVTTVSGKVTVNHYLSGNVEFVFKNEIILISKEKLQCKLSGIAID